MKYTIQTILKNLDEFISLRQDLKNQISNNQTERFELIEPENERLPTSYFRNFRQADSTTQPFSSPTNDCRLNLPTLSSINNIYPPYLNFPWLAILFPYQQFWQSS